MQLLIKATASRRGLVPVKRMISRKGKPFIQTFYVRPDQAPKQNTVLERQDLVMLPAPAPKGIGPKGDDRLYIMRSSDTEFDEDGKGKTEAVKIPEKAIVKKFEKFGHNFVIHHDINRNGTLEPSQFTVTEVSTGKKLSGSYGDEEASAAEERAMSLLEAQGAEKVAEVIGKVPKLADDAEVYVEDTDDYNLPQPLTEEGIDEITRYIFNDVMDRGDEDDDQWEAFRTDTRGWIRENIKTDSDATAFMNDYGEDNYYEMQIALDGDMSMEDATSTVEAFSYIENNADDSYGSVDLDEIRDWWDHQGNPALEESDVWSFYGDNEYGEVTEGEALSVMINNGMSLSATEDWVQEQLDYYEEEYSHNLEDFEVTDRNDMEWDADSLNAIGQWVEGDVVRGARNAIKESDAKRRSGVDPSSVAYNDIGDVVQEKMTSCTYDAVYRGTSNDSWMEAEVGDVIPVGMASFSNSLNSAKGFGGSNTVIILENDRTSESKKIMGVDIEQLIEDVRGEGAGHEAASDSGIDQHEHEHEFIVRAPSIEITKVEDVEEEGLRYVYATVAEMSLIKAMQSEFDDRIARMEATFDEPLHRKVSE